MLRLKSFEKTKEPVADDGTSAADKVCAHCHQSLDIAARLEAIEHVLEMIAIMSTKTKLSVAEIRRSEAEKVAAAEDELSKVAEDGVSKVAEDNESKVAEDNVSKVAEDGVSKVAEDNESKVAEDNVSKVAEDNESKVAEDDASKVPEDDASKVAEDDASKVAEDNESKVAEDNVSKVAEDDASKVPEDDASKVPEDNEPKVAEDNVSKVDIELDKVTEKVAEDVNPNVEIGEVVFEKDESKVLPESSGAKEKPGSKNEQMHKFIEEKMAEFAHLPKAEQEAAVVAAAYKEIERIKKEKVVRKKN